MAKGLACAGTNHKTAW